MHGQLMAVDSCSIYLIVEEGCFVLSMHSDEYSP